MCDHINEIRTLYLRIKELKLGHKSCKKIRIRNVKKVDNPIKIQVDNEINELKNQLVLIETLEKKMDEVVRFVVVVSDDDEEDQSLINDDDLREQAEIERKLKEDLAQIELNKMKVKKPRKKKE